MKLGRRNMLVAALTAFFSIIAWPLRSMAKSSKALSEFTRVRPYLNTTGRLRYVTLHHRRDWTLAKLEVDIAMVNTRPTSQAYSYFAWQEAYGFKPEHARQANNAEQAGEYFIPFSVHRHSNQFTLDLHDYRDVKRLLELDLVFDMTPTEYAEWHIVAMLVVDGVLPRFLGRDYYLLKQAADEARFRNPCCHL